MKELTKEQYEILKKYERNLKTAVYSDYSRNMMTKDLKTILGIYDDVTEIPHSISFSCGSCQLGLLKRIGKIYFQYEDKLKKEAEEAKKSKNVKKTVKKAPSTKTK